MVGKDGSIKQMLLVNSLTYMHAAFHQGGSWTDLVCSTMATKPATADSPWNLIIYCDEVVPGNALAARNERKS